MFLEYGDKEIEYLKNADEVMGWVIDYIGPIYEKVNPDLFGALVFHILGQQISAQVQSVLWERLEEATGKTTPAAVVKLGKEGLRNLGMTNRKAETILNIAQEIENGTIDLEALREMDDMEVISELSKIRGVGKWTAEMLMMFSLNRKDVFTFGDVALNRGLKMMYDLEDIDKATFNKYKEMFSPYGTVACLYIWAVGEYKAPGVMEYLKEKKEGAKENRENSQN